jgi:hypothetical protein
MAGLLSTLLADPVPWDLADKAANGLLIDVIWAGLPLASPPQGGLRDAILNASSDLELLRVIKDWRTFIFVLNLWAHSGDVSAAVAEGATYAGGVRPSHTVAHLDGQIQLGTQVARAIEGNKSVCNQSHDLRALANVWFWAGIGERYAPDERDWPAEAAGCAALAVGVANLPTNLTANGSDSLGLTFVLKFSDGTQVPADVEATLQGSGFTFASTGGSTMTASVTGTSTLNAGVFATQGPPYSLTPSACWYLDGIERNLCTTMAPLPFGAGATPTPGPQSSGSTSQLPDLTGSYVISGHSVNAQQCGATFSFNGTAKVVQSGAAVTVTWTFDALTTPDADSCLQGQWTQVVKSGEFSGTLMGDMKVGFRIKGIPLSCGGPVAGGEVQVGLSPRLSIVIANDCGPSVFARADFVGP